MSMMIEAPTQTQPEERLPGPIESPIPGTVVSASPMPLKLLRDLCIETKVDRWAWLGVALIVVALYAGLTFRFWAPADSGVDQNAYLVGGRLIAEHLTPRYELPNPFAYVGGMFVRMSPADQPGGVYYPKYPFGLPLLYAMFFWAHSIAVHLPASLHLSFQPGVAMFLVSPVSAVLAVLGMFFLARLIAGSFAAVLSSIMLGTSQVMIVLSNNPNSHASCVAFIVWGMFLLIRWWQTGTPWRGALGGFMIGYAGTIRYSEALLVLSVGIVCLSRLQWSNWRTYVALLATAVLGCGVVLISGQWAVHGWFHGGSQWIAGSWLRTVGGVLLIGAAGGCVPVMPWRDWKPYLLRILPGLMWLIPVGAMLIFNQKTMHSWTGYDATNESDFGAAFTWRKFLLTWEQVIRTFYDLALFWITPFGVAGLLMLFRRSWQLGLAMLAWLLPGVALYTAYYWSPDRDVAYARFFVSFFPVVILGVAVCFHDGILGRTGTIDPEVKITKRNWREWVGFNSSMPLAISAGVVVAIASGVSVYRTVHGLRDGSAGVREPNEDYRERLSLAVTGRILLDTVPAHSLLFTDGSGGISAPANYVQSIGDWELYPADAFSMDGSRRGFGGGRNNRAGNNRAGGRGNFGAGGNGGGNGGPNGNGGARGGFGGPPGGGGGMGFGNNQNNNDPNAVVATPVQPEQQEYHAGLYKGKTSHQLYQLEADAVTAAFNADRRVFLLVDKGRVDTFEENLNQIGKYQYKLLGGWQDVALPPEKEDDTQDNNPWGGNGGGFGPRLGGRGNIFNLIAAIQDWRLIEVKPSDPKTVDAKK